MWANGGGRSTNFSDWECRRNEIKTQIENYEIGTKPPRPDSVRAVYNTATATGAPDTLRVYVTKNGKTLTLTSQVYRPAVSGSFPAVIGMNSPSGSVPATVFTGRNIARITFNHNQVTTYGNPQLSDPYYQLYPDQNLVNAGQYSAWAWGVSRIIDGLELVQSSLPVDLNHIGVTGCSYAGKMALFSGAFDERIALTIAQESGGGGAPAWRVSHNLEPNGTVEKIDNTDYRWFRDSMALFSGENVYKLPHDHHELMAMIAPRALLVTGNTDFTWLSNRANYISARATKQVYNTFGIADRFGFYIDGGHAHCAVPATQVPAMQAFVDKFLVGNTTVNTDTIAVHPYPQLDYQRWYQWWGTGNPVLPPPPPEPLGKRIWMEAECARVGSSWTVVADPDASNGKYVVVKSGLSSPVTAPASDSAYLVMPFMVDSAATYNFLSRLNVAAADDYSYWMKIDGGNFQMAGSQLLGSNAGFESGLSGWTILNSTGATISASNAAADAHAGSGAMKVVNPTAQTGNQWRVQVSSAAFPTTIGKQYVISYWVKAASAGGSIRLSTGPSNALYQADQAIGTSWQQISWTITASLTSTTFLFDMGQVANTYYIDDASVKEVNADGWRWVKLQDAVLSAGAHTLTVGYRDGGAKLDKMLITTSSAVITGLGDTATNCGTNAPLPLSLVSYQAALRPTGEVLLRWNSASELNNKQYRIERSQDGRDYSAIVTVAGRGTFSGASAYSYLDPKPGKGMNYYRLVQVDVDGHESVLGIRTVNVAAGKTPVQVYPNPARSVLNIDLGTNETVRKQVKVYNFSGKVIFNRQLEVVNGMIKLNLDQRPAAGVYLVKIGDADQVSVIFQ